MNRSNRLTSMAAMWFWLVCFWAVCSSYGASAQTGFEVYFDTDNEVATGCSVTPAGAGAISGLEYRLSITTGGNPLVVSSTELSPCVAGSFAAAVAVSPAITGSNLGPGGSDVIEAQLSFAQLGITDPSEVRVYFSGAASGDADVIGINNLISITVTPAQLMSDGAVLGVPTLGYFALLLLPAVLFFARRHLPNSGVQLLFVLLFLPLLSAPLVWAMTMAVDGLIDDWAGISPVATDPGNDGDGVELEQVFLAADGQNIFIRIDASELDDLPPTMSNQSVNVDEDISKLITLTASDPENKNLMFAVTTPPGQGGLSVVDNSGINTGSVSYTPNSHFAGSDSFVVEVSDGVSSVSATISLSVAPINDPPVVMSGVVSNQLATGNIHIEPGASQTLLENLVVADVDSPLSSINVSGAATPGSLSFNSAQGGNVTILDAATGRYRYNPPAGFNGSDTINYTICDASACSSANPVTVTVADRVWFVDATAVVGGDGRLLSPFNELVAVDDLTTTAFSNSVLDQAGDTIYLRAGSAPASKLYGGGLVLLANQKLIGDGATISLFTAAGITLAPGSSGLLAVPSGNLPRISAAATAAISLGANNTIRGVELYDSDVKLSGTNFGTVTIRDSILTGAGRILDLDTGTVDIDVAVMSSSSSNASPIEMNNVSGTVLAGLAGVPSSISNIGNLNANNSNGIVLTSIGALTFSYGGDINSSASLRSAVSIDGMSSGAITFSGNLLDDAAAGGDVTVNNMQAGSVVFSGSSKVISSNARSAVNLTANGLAAEVSFTGGGLDIDSNTATGFRAVNAGTVEVSGAANSVTALNGRALNITSSTIGAGHVSFDSLSSSNTTSAILLGDTGSLGGLKVLGNGGATSQGGDGSGGLISGITGDAIELVNTAFVSLRDMNILTSNDRHLVANTVNGLELREMTFDGAQVVINGDGALSGVRVNNWTLADSIIRNNGSAAGEQGVYWQHPKGTNLISGNSFSNSSENQLSINSSETDPAGPVQFSLLRNQFSNLNGPDSNSHLFVFLSSSANVNFDIGDGTLLNRNTFDTGKEGIELLARGSSQTHVLVNNNVRTNGATDVLSLTVDEAATLTFDIKNNNFGDALTAFDSDEGVILTAESNSTTASLSGHVRDNTFTSLLDNYIALRGLGQSTSRLNVNNNQVLGPQEQFSTVIFEFSIGESAQLDLTVTGNTLTPADTSAGISVIKENSALATARLCLNMLNNTVTDTNPTTFADLDIYSAGQGAFNLQGFSGNGSNTGDVESWVLGNGNTIDVTADIASGTPGFGVEICALVP